MRNLVLIELYNPERKCMYSRLFYLFVSFLIGSPELLSGRYISWIRTAVLLPISHSPDLCPCHLQLLLQLLLLCRVFSSFCLFLSLCLVTVELSMLPNSHPTFLWRPCPSLLSTGPILFAGLPPLFLCLHSHTISSSWGCFAGNFFGVVSCMM